MTSPLKSLSQFCSNVIWSLLRLGERKIAKMVTVCWPRWSPCPYMVKTSNKYSAPEPRMPWGWIFAQIIGDERSTKIAKIIVVHWCFTFLRRGQLCFPMHLYGTHTFVWKKCWEFQTTSPLKPLGQCCSNFIWSLLRFGEQKIAKIVTIHWLRWSPSPYTQSTFYVNLYRAVIGPSG